MWITIGVLSILWLLMLIAALVSFAYRVVIARSAAPPDPAIIFRGLTTLAIFKAKRVLTAKHAKA